MKLEGSHDGKKKSRGSKIRLSAISVSLDQVHSS